MTSDMPWCADCVEPEVFGGPRKTYKFTSNCDNCDDLIGETEKGRVYRNNRPGRKQVVIDEIKTNKDSLKVGRYTLDADGITIDQPTFEVEKTVAYLQKFSEGEKAFMKREREIADIERRVKAAGLPQASGPDDVGKAGTDIAVASDVVPTPFVNYKRPVASPKMEVQVPFETETGVVMPPLPKHECELPKAIVTHVDKWESKKRTDEVKIKDGSVFTCACGKDWFVRVQKVPYHISEYDPQYISSWKEIRWFNVGRRMDLRNRKEEA